MSFRDQIIHAARRARQLAQLHQVIDERLADPLLSPRRVAAECGISPRTLHALFAQSGVSFATYVTHGRLAEARERLKDAATVERPISEIAFALGFNSLATFYRVYRARYGEAPGDTRLRAILQQQQEFPRDEI